MELLVVLALIVLVIGIGTSMSGRRGSPAAPSARQSEEPATAQEPAEFEAERNSVIASVEAGNLSPQRAQAILDQAPRLNLPPETVKKLVALRSPPQYFIPTRCKVCDAPAIPGDDMCYTHHTK